ncbi:MAG: aminotransferase class V-fold PLP-dependent enzyme [Sedimentisphaerales bacterium]|nr:aminotransferase class V-fold PLP-dependent enzyme [Sedimentisphaerales bacterium]
MSNSLEFKIATEGWEFDQIHRLNYETFVEEIPHYNSETQGKKVDRFHNDNIYVICISKDKLVGMLAVRSKRPFSLDQKVSNIDSYLPKAKSICEIRLLAVKKEFRRSRVPYKLLLTAAQYCQAQGHDLAIISGILNQQKLYKHMGFVPFGPVVGKPGAAFQPMYLTVGKYHDSIKHSCDIVPLDYGTNLLPGPVQISPDVKDAFSTPAISHRSQSFLKIHKDTQKHLCRLVNSKYVEIFMGSGTLANDVIAGQLSLIKAKGLILSNGEFGQRLINQAKSFKLNFDTLSLSWGQKFDIEGIAEILENNSDVEWLWAVHCETSTGMLNDLEMLKRLCHDNNILLCLDCVSSIGTTEIDLSDVYLASGVSGKALGAYPGLSMVFYNHKLPPSTGSLPVYLDLALYSERNGVPFTVSSNLVYALNIALKNYNLKKKLEHVSAVSLWFREELDKIGAQVVVPPQYASPFVITISLSNRLNSEEIGRQLETKGFLMSYKSSYLLKRNWVQICLMGEFSKENLRRLLETLQYVLIPKVEVKEIPLKLQKADSVINQ